ncbi:MAG: hypothetical protein ACO1QB_12595 [Verrucomicrobiales bacterium]
MNIDRFAVATMTLARSPEEERQLREALSELKNTGLQVYVADGGSPAPFLDFVKGLGFELLLPASRGLVPQILMSIREAASRSGKPFLLYTEPDKTAFFRHSLPPYLNSFQEPKNFGCEIFSRNSENFSTFPATQQYAERVINELAFDLMGVRGDYTYGPFVFPSHCISELDGILPEHGWGWRFFFFARLAKRGMGIYFKESGAPCPPTQRNENSLPERIYRMKQLKQNIDGLIAGSEN